MLAASIRNAVPSELSREMCGPILFENYYVSNIKRWLSFGYPVWSYIFSSLCLPQDSTIELFLLLVLSLHLWLNCEEVLYIYIYRPLSRIEIEENYDRDYRLERKILLNKRWISVFEVDKWKPVVDLDNRLNIACKRNICVKYQMIEEKFLCLIVATTGSGIRT